MRSLPRLLVPSVLALAAACSSKPSNSRALAAPEVAKVGDAGLALAAPQAVPGDAGLALAAPQAVPGDAGLALAAPQAVPGDAGLALAAPQNVPGGGGCTYTEIKGRCQLTAVGDYPAMTFIGTVDGKAVELAGNAVDDTAAFKPFRVGTSAACTLKFEKQGTCTPCLTSVGPCGQAAWGAQSAHK